MQNNNTVYYDGLNAEKYGHLYTIVEINSKYKDLKTREWIPCVIYRDNENNNLFVRELNDFKNNFKKY